MKNCSRCGLEFSCGAKENQCWCMNLKPVRDIPKEYQDCLCPDCLSVFQMPESKEANLKEGDDFYLENGLMVFTELYHKKRGHCCRNGCRHCPYP